MLTVSRLSVTPVRSLALHHPEQVELGPHGVADDRRYLILTEDDRVFDGTKHGPLVQMSAVVEHDPERLALTFPDGTVVAGLVELGGARVIEVYGRRFTVRSVSGPWAAAVSTHAGRRLTIVRAERRPEERDRNPVSIVSEASVDELARRENGGDALDARRFRMLIQVAGARPHEEDAWLGRRVAIGRAVVRVTKPVSRCVITTQNPSTGLRDFPTLHAIKAYRGLRDGRHVDFGVYADVEEPGPVTVGDVVHPLEALPP